MNLSDKTCLVFDHGLFTYVAERLGRDFGTVLYYSPYRADMPRSNRAIIGNGLDNVTRVESWIDNIDDVDLWVFPDIYEGDIQDYLRGLKKRVWGGGRSDALEYNRWDFRRLQHKSGMAIPEVHHAVGITELRKHLKDVEDRFVKVDKWRGDVESFHHHSYSTSESYINDLEYRLGPKKENIGFVIETPDGECEVGYDGWCIDGKFPPVAGYGYEVKDNAYIGRIVPYEQMPHVLTDVNEQMAPILKRHGMRGFYSTEVRIRKDKTGFLLDPCLRCGSPPGEVMVEAYSNFSEVLWEGAEGNIISPKPLGSYTAMAIVYSNYGDSNWMEIEIDDEALPWIKVIKETRIGGRRYFVPEAKGILTVAAVCACEKTLKDAIDKVKERSEMIRGHDISVEVSSLDKAQDYIQEGKQLGVNF